MNKLKITKHDLNMILEFFARLEDDGRLVWHDDKYNGRFADIRWLSTYGETYIKDGTVYITMNKLGLFKYNVKEMMTRWAHVDGNVKHGLVVWDDLGCKRKTFKEAKELCLDGKVYLIAGYLYTK